LIWQGKQLFRELAYDIFLLKVINRLQGKHKRERKVRERYIYEKDQVNIQQNKKKIKMKKAKN
jgi:hypothetical protein